MREEKGYILYHPQIGRFSGNYDRRRDPGRMFRRSVVLLYRICLNYAASWMQEILGLCQGHPGRTALWMGALFLMAVITGLLVKWEPMISGSGIPQLKGEMEGKLHQNWRRILPAKFLGGFLGLFGGLALGREGPSIQLGAMAGKASQEC